MVGRPVPDEAVHQESLLIAVLQHSAKPADARRWNHLTIKILVVDDSPTERHVLNDMLTKAGFEVVACDNGQDAVAKAKQMMPDLILMDVVMPGQNGFQLTRALSRDPVTQDIPIIMCTSKNQQTDRIWGMRQGARDYVTKPVKPEELLEKISALG
jgi:twitching motility two-component system response regulator PilH